MFITGVQTYHVRNLEWHQWISITAVKAGVCQSASIAIKVSPSCNCPYANNLGIMCLLGHQSIGRMPAMHMFRRSRRDSLWIQFLQWGREIGPLIFQISHPWPWAPAMVWDRFCFAGSTTARTLLKQYKETAQAPSKWYTAYIGLNRLGVSILESEVDNFLIVSQRMPRVSLSTRQW